MRIKLAYANALCRFITQRYAQKARKYMLNVHIGYPRGMWYNNYICAACDMYLTILNSEERYEIKRYQGTSQEAHG